jgi:hypothetical protein
LDAEYVRPFAGATGARLLELAKCDPGETVQFARSVVAKATEMARGDVLVFDRHWMTVCSLVPEPHWSVWTPIPATALCWADLSTTLARLAGRDEDEESVLEHRRYLRCYWDMAHRFHCFTVRTDQESEDRSLERLVEWSAGQIPRQKAQ